MSEKEREFRRLHYCGTCKTLGTLYGQKARLLLNLDVIFLAELLNVLADENLKSWQRAYQSYNCLSLPEEMEMPIALSFAATTNVILTKFKLADHLLDSNKHRYKFADRAFSEEFQTAEKLLKDWNFPLQKVKDILFEQTKIEAEETTSENSQTILDNCANPTAQTTAIFFAEGVKLIGKAEFQHIVSEIGFAFGKLIYFLDAFEDYEKDFRENQFNAIRSAFWLSEDKMSVKVKRKVISILHELESGIIENIYKLPIAETQKVLFASRLQQNLQRKLATTSFILMAKTGCQPKRGLSFSERWQKAREIALHLTASLKKNWEAPFAFVFVFVVALLSPIQARQAKSWQDCAGLSFNLMFLSAIFGSVFVSAKPVLMQNPTENTGGVPPQKKKRKKKGNDGNNSGWDFCCCDCSDGCDCCCDCGDCCDCVSCDC
ncbi:MAG: DUF5685 family protein [Acidobacteriota bacterium]|nr:DUF5685 family protein [Acidobacteriota bacterium]